VHIEKKSVTNSLYISA